MRECSVNIRLRLDVAVERTVPIGFVLDFNAFGEIIGLEILDLRHCLGRRCLKGFEEAIAAHPKPLSYSYDKDADAFYLKMGRERSPDAFYLTMHLERSVDQCTVGGTVMLDADGRIVGFQADVAGQQQGQSSD